MDATEDVMPESAPVEAVEAPPAAEAPATLRGALEKAFDAPAPAKTPDEGETVAQAKARDEAGRFAPKGKAAPPTVRKAGEAPPAPMKAAAPAPVVPAAAPEGPKPPQSWKPLAREKWASLPEEARAEVLRREGEIAKTLQETAEARRFADSVREVVRPFEAQIRAEGSTPEKAIANLMQTAMALRTAPPAHKAGLVASIIRDYGVPLDALVAHLQGQPPPQAAQQSAVDPDAIAERVQAQLLERLQAERQQRAVQKATETIDKFLADKEFGEELREDMADILERAARRGSTLTLEQAYTRAAREHPDVSPVFEQREAAARAAKAAASTQRSRLAASSVRSSPTTTPVASSGKADLRSALEAAFDSR